MSSPQENNAARTISYAQALHEAMRQEMERDPSVFVMGHGLDDTHSIFGTTLGLHEEFGPERLFDVPLAEDGMAGIVIGAAMAGMRPILVHQRMDLMASCVSQLVNMGAKTRHILAGAHKLPLVVRCIIGGSEGQGAQRTEAFHSYFMHVPGLKVFAPATPYDAKGCLITAICDDNPVVIIEHKMLHPVTGHVPEKAYEVPFGQARILTTGGDITIVGISLMALECVRAKRLLAGKGVNAEVIDPVCLSPLDMGTIAASVRRTGRLLVVDTAWLACGAAGEIVMRVLEMLGTSAVRSVARMGYPPTPCLAKPILETLFCPNAQTIAEIAFSMVRPDTTEAGEWDMSLIAADEITEFPGSFQGVEQ